MNFKKNPSIESMPPTNQDQPKNTLETKKNEEIKQLETLVDKTIVDLHTTELALEKLLPTLKQRFQKKVPRMI